MKTGTPVQTFFKLFWYTQMATCPQSGESTVTIPSPASLRLPAIIWVFKKITLGVPQAILLMATPSYGYPEQWILRYHAHRYHAMPSPGFESPTS
jgi:hypothetical protein